MILRFAAHMKDIKLIASILGGTLVLLLGISLFFVKAGGSAGPIDSQKLVLGATNSQGPEAAPVTIVEFSDFECPACRAAHPLVESLVSQYGDKIHLIYRNFPLTSIHRNAMPTAMAAQAAGVQGKFWEYATILFDQQDSWSQVRNPADLFVTYAQQAEVSDIDKFRQDLEKQTYRDQVLKDLQLGNEIGITATPTFVVNGEKVSTDGLKLAVEKILSKPNQD